MPKYETDGTAFSEKDIKIMHTTMQTLGRFAIISGSMLVALINVVIFSGTETLNEDQRVALYADVYVYALVIPCLLYTSPSPRDRTRSRMPSSA